MPFSKQRRTHTLFMILFFVCMGITTEVFFTATMSFINQTPLCDKPRFALAGMSYIWMSFIYGLIPILGIVFYDKVKHYPLAIRLLIYTGLIYAVEFTSGFLLDKITGRCPWQYTTGWHVMGYIRLDYLPAWALFAYVVERVYVFLNYRVVR